jgi:hypothetical protein
MRAIPGLAAPASRSSGGGARVTRTTRSRSSCRLRKPRRTAPRAESSGTGVHNARLGYGERVQRLLPLRDEQPPDDAIVVIRGGVLSPQGVERAATRSQRLFGMLGISVEAALGVSVLEACRTSERLARYGHVQLSSCGRLRHAGFALLATFEHPHFTVVLPELSDLTLARLVGCFDGPVPNPARPDER